MEDMTMKLSNFDLKSPVLALLMCLFASLAAFSADSAAVADKAAVNEAYEYRIERREKRWMRLMPNLYTLQFAGGIGMVSLGQGWDYGSSDQWETHLLLGYLPKRYGWHHYWTLTLKEIYVPWRFRLGGNWRVKPFFVSLSVNSILHGDFWVSEPDRYPNGYYGFSSKIRFHLGIGQRFSFYIPEHDRYLGRKLSVYYEISTCDLYVRQKVLSGSIPLRDIITLGVGIIYTI